MPRSAEIRSAHDERGMVNRRFLRASDMRATVPRSAEIRSAHDGRGLVTRRFLRAEGAAFVGAVRSAGNMNRENGIGQRFPASTISS